MHLKLGLGSKLQEHVDTSSAAAATSIEERRGAVDGHSIDLGKGKERPRGFAVPLWLSSSQFLHIGLEKVPMLVNREAGDF